MSNEENIEYAENTPEPLSIGQALRAAREARGMSLDEASNQTKIKRSFIEYLENNEFEKVHNLMTAKGLLKVYAALLNLDVEEIHKQFLAMYPSEAGYKASREVKVGMAVDRRTLFPNGLRTMNSPGLSHSSPTAYRKHNKRNNKLLVRIIAVVVIISTIMTIVTMYFRSAMGEIRNDDIRQQSDLSTLEAMDTPETSRQRTYDQNKVYVEATALNNTYVTITTVDNGRVLPQSTMMNRGDLKSWDGNQYIRIRSTTPRSLRLRVNGKNEGIMEEPEKIFFTPSAASANISAEPTANAIERTPVRTDTIPPVPNNNPTPTDNTADILNSI